MLTTNLLPQEEKKIVKSEDLRRIIVFYGLTAAVMFGCGIILLLPSFLPIFLEKQEIEKTLEFERQVFAKFNAKGITARIDKTRKIIDLIKSRDVIQESVSKIAENLFSYAGEDVEITALVIKEDGGVNLNGIAVTRDHLLKFEKKLRDSGKFTEISSPLSNLIKEQNVIFSISAKLKS